MFQNNLLMAAAANASGGADLVSIENSALYVSGNSQNLVRTEVAGSSTQKMYISFWIYFTSRGIFHFTWGITESSGNSLNYLGINTDSTLVYLDRDSSITAQCHLITTQVFRDTGWYHVELLFDTTQSVASNRNIFKVNGKRITDFNTETNYTLNDNFGSAGIADNFCTFGDYHVSAYYYLDGYMAEVVRIDGDPAGISTGEFDSTGLYWTPKSSAEIKALTFGNNGCYLDNVTNAQTDASGEGHNFTNNNSVTTTTHTPTNTEALPNILQSWSAYMTLTNGNKTVTNSSSYSGIPLSLPVKMGGSGIYWIEFRVDSKNSNQAQFPLFGVAPADHNFNVANSYAGSDADSISYRADGTKITGGSTSAYGAAFVVSDVIGMLITESSGTVTMYKQTSGTGSFATQGNLITSLSGDYIVAILPMDDTSSSTGPATITCRIDSSEWGNSSPPPGAKALNTTNIAAATSRTASDTTKYFDTILYEGNGDGQRVGQFQPFDNAFTVGNGALFNGTSQSLTKTFGSAGNQKTWTYSTWAKISKRGDFAFMATASYTTAFQTTSPAGEDNQLLFFLYAGGTFPLYLRSTLNISDYSQWQHFMVVYDSTESASADRGKIYHNGVQITEWAQTALYPTLNVDSGWNGTVEQSIGKRDAGYYLNGYMAETVFIDGLALTPSSFGQTDTSTNRWIPKDVTGLTYGTNGFYLDYSDASDMGEDQAGSNDWTNVNTVAQVTDSPTTNLATFDPLFTGIGATTVLSNGNLTGTKSGVSFGGRTTLGMTSGKYTAQFTATTNFGAEVGIFAADATESGGTWGGSMNAYAQTGNQLIDTVYYTGATYATLAAGDVVRVEVDMDAKSVQFFKDGASQGTQTINSNQVYYFGCRKYQAGTIVLNIATPTLSTGFSILSQDNLTSTDQFISAFSWIKNRDATDNHMLFDRVRGVTNDMHSNTTDIQVTNNETLQSFLAGGVQVGNDVQVNTVNESYALWNWMMETTGSGASNEDGSINTTSTLVDTTLGMSISTYTGTGANATLGHGLGVVPEMVICKGLDTVNHWVVYHKALGNTSALLLNATNAKQSADAKWWNNTTPTSSLVSLGTAGDSNASTKLFVMYAFAPSQFISIGSYEGNGNADGSFIPTLNSLGVPIQPVWAMTKSADSTSEWDIYDNKRLGYNVENAHLDANATTVESTADNLDIVTGGLKMRIATDPNVAETYVYMAIGTPIIDTDGRIIAGR